MKLKDLILTINEFVNSNELSALAGASDLQDLEVQDDTVSEVKTKLNGLMSMEAAQNNHDLETYFKKKLHPSIKGELLGNIDSDLLKVSKELLGEDSATLFEGLDYTGDKIKKFADHTKELLSKKSNDPKLKETLEQQRKQLEELSKGFETDLKKKDEEINQIKQDYQTKLIKKEFNSLMSNYKLGEKYQDEDFKAFIYDKKYKEVLDKAKLTLNDKGSLIPKNKENPELDFYIGNKKVESVKDILDPLMTDYIVKKPSGGNEKPQYKTKGETDLDKLPPMARDRILAQQENYK